jgi:hypothetical protein
MGEAGGAFVGYRAGKAVTYAAYDRVVRAVVENPKIAQNLLFTIESGAKPERYGPFIGAMIQQYETERSNAEKKAVTP